jgi:hypothetical protein
MNTKENHPTKSVKYEKKTPSKKTPDEKLKKELLELSLNPTKENYQRRQEIIKLLQ